MNENKKYQEKYQSMKKSQVLNEQERYPEDLDAEIRTEQLLDAVYTMSLPDIGMDELEYLAKYADINVYYINILDGIALFSKKTLSDSELEKIERALIRRLEHG